MSSVPAKSVASDDFREHSELAFDERNKRDRTKVPHKSQIERNVLQRLLPDGSRFDQE